MSWFLKLRVRQFLECSLADDFCKRSPERGACLFLLKNCYYEIWYCNSIWGILWRGGEGLLSKCELPSPACCPRPPPTEEKNEAAAKGPTTKHHQLQHCGPEIWTKAPKIDKIHYKCNKKIKIMKTNTPPTEEKNEVEQTPPSPTSSQLSNRPAWICILQHKYTRIWNNHTKNERIK